MLVKETKISFEILHYSLKSKFLAIYCSITRYLQPDIIKNLMILAKSDEQKVYQRQSEHPTMFVK